MEPTTPRCPACGQEIPYPPFDVFALLDEIDREQAEIEMCEPWAH